MSAMSAPTQHHSCAAFARLDQAVHCSIAVVVTAPSLQDLHFLVVGAVDQAVVVVDLTRPIPRQIAFQWLRLSSPENGSRWISAVRRTILVAVFRSTPSQCRKSSQASESKWILCITPPPAPRVPPWSGRRRLGQSANLAAAPTIAAKASHAADVPRLRVQPMRLAGRERQPRRAASAAGPPRSCSQAGRGGPLADRAPSP